MLRDSGICPLADLQLGICREAQFAWYAGEIWAHAKIPMSGEGSNPLPGTVNRHLSPQRYGNPVQVDSVQLPRAPSVTLDTTKCHEVGASPFAIADRALGLSVPD